MLNSKNEIITPAKAQIAADIMLRNAFEDILIVEDVQGSIQIALEGFYGSFKINRFAIDFVPKAPYLLEAINFSPCQFNYVPLQQSHLTFRVWPLHGEKLSEMIPSNKIEIESMAREMQFRIQHMNKMWLTRRPR